MPQLLVLDHTGPESRQRVADLARELDVAMSAACAEGAPIRLVVGPQGSGSYDEEVDRPVVLCREEGVASGLVLVVVGGTSLSAYLTSGSPEPFDRLGLCTWKSAAACGLMPEPQRVDLPPSMIDDPQLLATLLIGLQALVRGSHRAALDRFETVAGDFELPGFASYNFAFWLALAYLDAAQCLGSNSHFKAATDQVSLALRSRNRRTPAVVGAAMYRCLAQTHYQRPAGDPERECAEALISIKRGFRLIDPASYPVDWARLLYERAGVALYRPAGKSLATLVGARRDLMGALKVFDSARFPLEYSNCHNALGRLDADWSGEGRREHQHSAAWHYSSALRIRKKASHPWHFAQTQHNLGILLLQRVEGVQADNADRAVGCLTQALSIFDAVRFPHRHRQSLAALGRAYLRRNASADDVRRAFLCFQQVAASVTADSFPYLYGRTLFDLGNAGCQVDGLDVGGPAWAIERYREALLVFPATQFPVDRAHVLVALAGALIVAVGAGQEGAGAEALACYREALDIFERVDRPADAACVHACLAVVLLAGQPRLGGEVHALAEFHLQAAEKLVSDGTVRDVGGDDIEGIVLALLSDARAFGMAVSDMTDQAG